MRKSQPFSYFLSFIQHHTNAQDCFIGLGFCWGFLCCGWEYFNLLSRTLLVNYDTESRKITVRIFWQILNNFKISFCLIDRYLISQHTQYTAAARIMGQTVKWALRNLISHCQPDENNENIPVLGILKFGDGGLGVGEREGGLIKFWPI